MTFRLSVLFPVLSSSGSAGNLSVLARNCCTSLKNKNKRFRFTSCAFLQNKLLVGFLLPESRPVPPGFPLMSQPEVFFPFVHQTSLVDTWYRRVLLIRLLLSPKIIVVLTRRISILWESCAGFFRRPRLLQFPDTCALFRMYQGLVRFLYAKLRCFICQLFQVLNRRWMISLVPQRRYSWVVG